MSCYINEGLNPPTVHDPYDDLMPLYPVLSWGRNVENQFTSRYGYDLREELAALFFGSGKHAERVRFDFWRLMSDLYEQSFFAQISDWCARHNVDFSGHILLEDNIRYHTVFEGNYFRLLRHMHTHRESICCNPCHRSCGSSPLHLSWYPLLPMPTAVRTS